MMRHTPVCVAFFFYLHDWQKKYIFADWSATKLPLSMQRSDFEIMAPVGSWESLAAAIEAGADSVYFGIEKLNMRSRSSANFTTDDLCEIVRM